MRDVEAVYMILEFSAFCMEILENEWMDAVKVHLVNPCLSAQTGTTSMRHWVLAEANLLSDDTVTKQRYV